MDDYLKIFEKFKEVKAVADYIDDVRRLRHYYQTQQFLEMKKHITNLMAKYSVEAVVWNTVNHEMPLTYEQSYKNAEDFLRMEGAIIVVKKVKNYAQRLNGDELAFVESMCKLMK